jgi:hypothetical protein
MKLLNKVKEILEIYDLSVKLPEGCKNHYHLQLDFESDVPIEIKKKYSDSALYEKYVYNIPHGYYGFAIGEPTPINWLRAIDDILSLLIKKDKNFEIHQIKMKYGGIRFYCYSSVIEDIDEISTHIETKMWDKNLIY